MEVKLARLFLVGTFIVSNLPACNFKHPCGDEGHPQNGTGFVKGETVYGLSLRWNELIGEPQYRPSTRQIIVHDKEYIPEDVAKTGEWAAFTASGVEYATEKTQSVGQRYSGESEPPDTLAACVYPGGRIVRIK